MSTKQPPPPAPPHVWDFVEELIDEEDLARLAAMTPEQVAEEAKKSSLDAAAAQALLEKARAGAGRAPAPAGKVVSLEAARERRRPRSVLPWLAAAAVVLLVIAGAAVRNPLRDRVEAWLSPPPPPTTTVPVPVPRPHEETPAEKAARLRAAALVNVKKGYMGDATDELDEARDIDPTGELLPDVTNARIEITEGRKDTGVYSKTHVGSDEVPLQRRNRQEH